MKLRLITANRNARQTLLQATVLVGHRDSVLEALHQLALFDEALRLCIMRHPQVAVFLAGEKYF